MSQCIGIRSAIGYYGLRVRPGDERPVANDPEQMGRAKMARQNAFLYRAISLRLP
jgi:hypothetical protein